LSDPVLHVLAGPNGAGKTTFVELYLEPVVHLPFVNADVLAAQRWAADAEAHGHEASQLAAAERELLLERRASFITETVFSHPSKIDLVRQAKAAGYLVTLHIIAIPEELAVARVLSRVRHGGHSVPENKIRERYGRLFTHVAEAVGLCDEAIVYDNSRAERPYRQVALFLHGRPVGVPTWPPWIPPVLRLLS
jgi:predicted ABC-type ATPase